MSSSSSAGSIGWFICRRSGVAGASATVCFESLLHVHLFGPRDDEIDRVHELDPVGLHIAAQDAANLIDCINVF